MSMQGSAPIEQFPTIGTIQNPSIFYDGCDVYLGYEIAPIDGNGIAILKFKNVIDFRLNPMNVDGLGASEYPVEAWSITEITSSENRARWKALNPRFWSISFSDETLEILFESVEKCHEVRENVSPNAALAKYISDISLM